METAAKSTASVDDTDAKSTPIARPRISNSESESECPVCMQHRAEGIVAIQDVCGHAICHVCAVRLRVICRNFQCPICRENINESYLCPSRPPDVADAQRQCMQRDNNSAMRDDDHGLFFASAAIADVVKELQRHPCPQKDCDKSFAMIGHLEHHMKEKHSLFYCRTCLEHLKVFTSELQPYTRRQLNDHRNCGDSSLKTDSQLTRIRHGHPKCSICNIRQFDNDTLLHHNRYKHHICYGCERAPTPKFVVFRVFSEMMEHLRKEHFICDFGQCGEREMPRVFVTAQDLEIHRVAEHNATTLTGELFFQTSMRPTAPDNSRRDRRANSDDEVASGRMHAGPTLTPASGRQVRPNEYHAASAEFPTLTGDGTATQLATQQPRLPVSYDSAFPSLDARPSGSLPPAPRQSAPARLAPIPLRATSTTSKSIPKQSPYAGIRRRINESEFPSLPTARPPHQARTPAQAQRLPVGMTRPPIRPTASGSAQGIVSRPKKDVIQRHGVTKAKTAPAARQQSASADEFPSLGRAAQTNRPSGAWGSGKESKEKKRSTTPVDHSLSALSLDDNPSPEGRSGIEQAAADAQNGVESLSSAEAFPRLGGGDEDDDEKPTNNNRRTRDLGPWWRTGGAPGAKKGRSKNAWKKVAS